MDKSGAYDLFSLQAFLLRSIAAPTGFHFSQTEQNMSVAFGYERHACEQGFRGYGCNFEFQFLYAIPFSCPPSSSGSPHSTLSTKHRFTSMYVSKST